MKCAAWPMTFLTAQPCRRSLRVSQWNVAMTFMSLSFIGLTTPALPSASNPKDWTRSDASIPSWSLKPSFRRWDTAWSLTRCTTSASTPQTFRLSAYGITTTGSLLRLGAGALSTRIWSAPIHVAIITCSVWTLCAIHIAQLHPIGTTRMHGHTQPPEDAQHPPSSKGTCHSRRNECRLWGKQKVLAVPQAIKCYRNSHVCQIER